MVLNKTQIELLTDAAKHPHGIVATYRGYISSRKNGSYGARKSDAACKLRDAGLLELKNIHRSVHQLCHRMGSDVGSESIWQITERGRTAIR